MGRVNAAPRPGFDVAPPPGMGGEQRAAEFARERALERATESVEPTETAGDAI